MADEERPFEDVQPAGDGFSLPALKWRELVFVGALRAEGEAFVREASRPLPPFRIADLFPEGQRFSARRVGARVVIRRL
jgi:hypothetical protein